LDLFDWEVAGAQHHIVAGDDGQDLVHNRAQGARLVQDADAPRLAVGAAMVGG
jgi:hypothetical protein